jgi:Zn-dependent protease
MGNFTPRGIILAIEMLVALTIAMSAREFALASVGSRLGDPTPRLWGRRTLDPRAWFDPFGSGLVPGLIAVLWSVQVLVVPAAYGKPAPVDRSSLKRQPRDTVVVSVAGPATSLAIALVAGLAVRVLPATSELWVAAVVMTYVGASLTIFHLLPIPGLDGGRIVALMLSPQIRDTYRNADRYLPLFVLLFMFLGLTIGFLEIVAGAICNAAAGVSCRAAMSIG